MSTKIQLFRLQSFNKQEGRCWYCGVQMWQLSPAELGCAPNRAASRLRCTAEHLIAKCDGGKDIATNVVAACAHCNSTRHKRKNPPTPDLYLLQVHTRLNRGSWHNSWVRDHGFLDGFDPLTVNSKCGPSTAYPTD